MIHIVDENEIKFSAEVIESNGQFFIEMWDNRKHVATIRNFEPSVEDLKKMAESVNIG